MAKKRQALYGLIGFPVKHSFSCAMHNAAFNHCRIDAEYRLFEIPPAELENFLLDNKDLAGFNITIPHKVRARQILEKNFPPSGNKNLIEASAYYVKLSGAVNTVKRALSGLEYFNTDAVGFLKSLEEDLKFTIKGKTAMLFGCGGAGRAVIAALSWKNLGVKKIYLYDSEEESLLSFKEHLYSLPSEWKNIFQEKIEFIEKEKIAEKIEESQLLVNATPLGMKEGDLPPVDKNLLHKGLFVYDLVYNRNTELIKAARLVCGENKVSGGLGMLLYQGAAAWELWMGKLAPVEVMRQALNQELKKKC